MNTHTTYHNSSMINSSTYNYDKNTLIIEFKNGAEYEYYDVPEEEYKGLIAAPSTGKYFIENIKNSYSYAKI